MRHEVKVAGEADPEVVLKLTLRQSEAGALATIIMEELEWGQYKGGADKILQGLHPAFRDAAGHHSPRIEEVRKDGRSNMWARRAEDAEAR